MSKLTKKEQRDAMRSKREARQARRIINYIIWGFLVLFLIFFIGYAFFWA